MLFLIQNLIYYNSKKKKYKKTTIYVLNIVLHVEKINFNITRITRLINFTLFKTL